MKAILSVLFLLSCLALCAEQKVLTRVTVTSQPSGATVSVDGRDRGTTPITLFDLAPGRHHLKYRLAGYEERDRFFTTDEGPSIEKNEVLVQTKGLLLLQSEPSGANIAIDGVSVGETPRLITHLAAQGTYAVKLTHAGYQPLALTVRFNGREPLVRKEKLVLDSGVIDISSDPIGAEVTVNGVVRGKTPLKVKNVPKGRAVVKFKLDGYREEVRELAMRAGDVQTLPIVLTALPGTLHLVSDPEGARFYVNEEARGEGPLSITGLAPGDYVVRAEKKGFGTVTRTITIGNGASAREEFKLSNMMGRIEVRTDPPGVTVILDGRTLGVTKANGKSDVSDVFAIPNVLEGEHAILLRKAGYAEATRHPKVQNAKTTTANVRLKRIFTPNVEIVTDRGTYRGVLVANSAESVVVEISLGVQRSFPRSEIRKMNFIGDIVP